MKQKKSVGFSTIFVLGLIISTVIVFAVLIFLSYENVMQSTFDDCIKSVDDTCITIAKAADTIIDEDVDFELDSNEYKTQLIVQLAENMANTNSGAVYFCDDSTGVVFSINPLDSFSIINLKDTIAGDYKGSAAIDSTKSVVYSIRTISNANIRVIYAQVYDRGASLAQFNNILLYPSLIAIVIAIILFVLATQLLLTPIREMTRVFGHLSEGDYSVRVDERYINKGDYHFTAASGDISTMATVVNDMITKLENQENDRQIFISSVAHDIRTPVTSINGFVTAIMDGTIPPENQGHYLNIIKQELNRIKSLVVSMTEASSLSHVDPEVMEKFNVREMVTDIVDNLEPQLNTKGIVAEVRLDDDDRATYCYGEAQQLCRVVMNIITNAIKFTPEGGRILVETHAAPSDKKVLISVEDSGIGVAPEKRSRVFESFYKVDSSRTHEGFGLGLFICKQILQGHGQSIYLDEGKELGGAKFVFSFPVPPEGK